jgi:hypothetical protein
MMSACQDGDIIRVTCKMLLDPSLSEVQNVYHLMCQFTADRDDTTVVYGTKNWLDDAYTEIAADIPDNVLFNTIAFWNLTQDRPMDEVVWPTLSNGTCDGAPATEAQVAPLVLFNTQAPRSQGRKYLPPPCETSVGEFGDIEAAFVARLINFIATILDGAELLADNNLIPGNWSKLYDRFAPWISGILQQYARTQRRRVPGVGS